MATNETSNANVVLTADVSGYNQSLDQAQSSTQKLTSSLSALSTGLSNLRKAAAQRLVIFAAADVAALSAGVAIAARFEQQLKTLSGTTAAATKNSQQFTQSMNTYREGINRIARESSTSRGEIAQLTTALSQMGVKGPAEVVKVAKTMDQLGKATGESSRSMAASLSQFAQQMGTLGNGAASLDKYADSLLRVSTQAGVAASSVTSFAQAIAPVARAAGVSATEVIGFSAAFAQAGADGFAAANTFNSILSEITRGVQTGSPDMAKYANLIGVTAGEFERMNKTEAIIEIFDAINSAGPKSLQILDQLGIDGVRAQRAIQAVASSGNLNQMIASATGDNSGLVGKAAAASEDNLLSSLDRVKNQFEQIGSTIGEVWIRPLTKVVQLFGNVLGAVMPILDPILKIGSVIAGIVAPIAAVAAALLAIAPIITPLALAIAGLSGLRAMASGFRGGAGNINPNDRFQERYTAGNMGPVQRALFQTGAGAGALAGRFGFAQGGPTGSGAAGFIRGMAAYAAQGVGWYARANESLYDRARVAGTDYDNNRTSMRDNLSNAGDRLRGMFSSADNFRKGLDAASTRVTASVSNAPALGTSIKGAAADLARMGWAATRMTASMGASAAGAGVTQLGRVGGGLLGAMGGPYGLAIMGAMMGGMAIYKAQGDVERSNQENRELAASRMTQYGDYAKALDIATTEVNGFAAAVKVARISLSADDATDSVTSEDVVTAMTPGRQITSPFVAQGSRSSIIEWMKTLDPNIDPKVFDLLRVDLVQRFGAAEAMSMLNEYRSARGVGNQQGYTLMQGTQSSTVGEITGVNPATFQRLGFDAGRRAEASMNYGDMSDAIGQEAITNSLATALGTAQNLAGSLTTFGGYGSNNDDVVADFIAGSMNETLINLLAGARSASSERSGFSLQDIAPEDVLQTFLNALAKQPAFANNNLTVDDLGVPSFKSVSNETTSAARSFTDKVSDEQYAEHFWRSLYDAGDKETKDWFDRNGGIENFIGAYVNTSAVVNKSANPVLDEITSTTFGKFIANSEVIGRALSRLNDPQANQFAVDLMVDSSMSFAGSLDGAVQELQGFKNATNDTSNRLYQLADAAQQNLLAYRAADRQHMSFSERVDSSRIRMDGLLSDLGVAQDAIAGVPTFLVNPEAEKRVSDTGKQYDQFKSGELGPQIDAEIERLNSIGIATRDFNTQQVYQQQDFNTQKARNEYSFNLSMTRQREQFQRNELRATEDFNRQRAQAEQDYERQRKYALQDHQREIRNMVTQQMGTIYNPYESVRHSGAISKTMLFSNLRDQTRMLMNQRKNLNAFKKLFPTEEAARDAIDMLDLTNPANAGQLEELVRTMSSQDVAGLMQITGQRRRATASLVANEDNFGFRTQEEAFKRSMERQDENFERQMLRQERAFRKSLRRSREDFALSVANAKTDFQTNVTNAETDFQKAMTRARSSFNLSITDMYAGAANLATGLETVTGLLGDDSSGFIGKLAKLITMGEETDFQGTYFDTLITAVEDLTGKEIHVIASESTNKAVSQVSTMAQALSKIDGKTFRFDIKPITPGAGSPYGSAGGGLPAVELNEGATVGNILVNQYNFRGLRWGGRIGRGGHPSDTIPIMGADGEWVHRAEAARYYGDDVMSALNAGRIDRNAVRQAMQGTYATMVAFKGNERGGVTNIDASTNFSGAITVQAQDPNEMARRLARKQRSAALTRRR